MTYKEALVLQVGDSVRVKRFTGDYKVESIGIDKKSKEVVLKLDDGYRYCHRELKF